MGVAMAVERRMEVEVREGAKQLKRGVGNAPLRFGLRAQMAGRPGCVVGGGGWSIRYPDVGQVSGRNLFSPLNLFNLRKFLSNCAA